VRQNKNLAQIKLVLPRIKGEHMGLDMKDKKKVCGVIARRYQQADKKGRGKLLDEYTVTLDYNRDYLAHILANGGKARYAQVDGKPVKIIAQPALRCGRKALKTASPDRKQGRRPKYQGAAFKALLEDIWSLFDCLCGKLLAPMLRLMLDFLTAEYSLAPDMRDLLASVSPRTIDRILKPVKDQGWLRGLSLTKPGSLLRDQIPVRVLFNWDERKPGFFEFDRVAHCGADASGQFCQTLSGTNVGSGWTEAHALLNSAHRWVKERIPQIRDELPFPLAGVDSDNGGEFINHQHKDWCDQNHIQFTRGRPYRKNDNCFVEQKNGDVVRKTLGYHRFEGQDRYDALEAVYRCLNPLLNYWYPTLRLIAKEQQASGRYKKIYEKESKTPCQRLLESPEVAEEHRAELRRRLALFNPVALKREMDEARKRLLKLAAHRGVTGETA
jgi:hypothetical protein